MARDANIEAIYPLSPMQQGMLFHRLADGDSGTYFRQSLWELPGDVEPSALRRAWEHVLGRHSILRTAFVWKNLEEPLQVVRKSVRLPWQELDWRGSSAAEQKSRLELWLDDQRRQGFDLTRAPLLRLTLIRAEDSSFLFVWSFAQLLLDGWSRERLLREVATSYNAFRGGAEPQLDPPHPFRDYIAWLQRQDPARSETYWRSALAGLRDPVSLPDAGKPPAGRSGPATAERQLRLSAAASSALRDFARRRHLTLSTVLSGAWALVLANHAGREEVVLGAVVSGRPPGLPGVEGMLGLFINTLPLRVHVPRGAAVASWLEGIQEIQAAMREHEHTPLVRIQQWSEVPPGRPLFESTFVCQNYSSGSDFDERPSEAGNLREIASFEQVNYPLGLTVVPGASLLLVLAYSPSRFDAAAAERLLGHLQLLLEALPEKEEALLAELLLLSAAERHQLTLEWNDTGELQVSGVLVPDLFSRQARALGGRTAVMSPQGTLGYGDLDRLSNQLAHHLRARGIGPEKPVGVCIDRSPDLAVALLGILKSGGVYLPLDPDLSRERMELLLADAFGGTSAPVIVTLEAFTERVAGACPAGAHLVHLDADRAEIGGWPDQPPPHGLSEDHLAYLIFTSGSTGLPKAVGVSHGNLRDVLAASLRRFAWPTGARCLCLAPFTFDIFLFEMLNPLLSGGTCDLFPLRPAVDMPSLLTRLDEVEVVHAVPALLRQVVSAAREGVRGPFSGVKALFTGGDAVPADLLEPLAELFPGARRRILYGPTESTIICSAHEVLPEAGIPRALLGRPLPDACIHLLDPSFQPVPIGAVGEIFIGGTGVTRGYVARPDLTAERFLPDPFSGRQGTRLYRSGDLARRLPCGSLEFLGRTDRQVKIRGFRIEPGEIEAAIGAHPAVAAAVVTLWEENEGERRLVAYVVPRSGEPMEPRQVRTFLRKRLPEYMVPSDFVSLDSLPLTPHGKIDLRSLPVPERSRDDAGTAFSAPRTPLEELVAMIWADVLGVERVGTEDSFFDLGGHSLSAIRLGTRLQQVLGVELQLRELFDAPTVAALASRLERRCRDGSGATSAAPPLRPVDRDRALPLSFAQQRLWFLEQLEPGGALYNLPLALRLEGPLDAGVFAAALTEVARRQECLRTRFREHEGGALQQILPPSPLHPPLVDLRGAPGPVRAEVARGLVAGEAARPFDLAAGTLWRLLLVRLGDEDHIAVVVLHHAIADAWSVEILFEEVAEIYDRFCDGLSSPLPELPVQYADFSVWQREWLRGVVVAGELAWWRERLAGAPELMELPLDRPRPAVSAATGATASLRFPDSLTQRLRDLGRRQGATPFMTTFAGLGALLSIYTGQEDMVLGTPVAGRGRPEVERMIGLFVNTLALRIDPSGRPPFRHLLDRAREDLLAAVLHQDLPFEKLVDELKPGRDLSYTPLFQVMFAFQPSTAEAVTMRRIRVESLPVGTSSAKFDLALTVIDGGGSWEAVLTYRTQLFDRPTIDRMLRHYATLLDAAVTDPDRPFTELQILSPEESQALIAEGADREAGVGELRLVADRFVDQARLHRDGLALICGQAKRTFGELECDSNRLAGLLLDLGVGPEIRVGLLLDRTPDLVVSILGTFKAGGAYVPLDPGLPPERLRFFLLDAGIRILVTLERLQPELAGMDINVLRLDADADRIASRPPALPAAVRLPESAAYLIYTSGTTGTPKAVVVSHGHLAASLLSSGRRFDWNATDRMPCLAPFSFDIFLFELLSPLLAGGACELVPLRPALDLGSVAELLPTCTALHAVPTLMRQILEEVRSRPDGEEICRGMRKVFVGGDAVPADLLAEIPKVFPNARVWVLYGPTESTIICSSHEISTGGAAVSSPLGCPFEGVRLLVSSRSWRPVPPNVAGEIWIGGHAVARGYLNRPDLTAERFIPDPTGPEPGARLYRSGDLGRLRPGADLEFVGRTDQQIKIRGFRIEPGEVEAALERLQGVSQAVVVAHREVAAGAARLLAYIVPDGAAPSVAELRRALAHAVPDYMVPTLFVFLEALPRTAHGKIDRRALPAPSAERPTLDRGYAAPETRPEKVLAQIWSRLLRVERVGIHDSFFELGGDSILSLQVVSQARKAGLHLTPRQVFQSPTVAELAALAGPAAAEPEPRRVSGATPLTPIQSHFFSLPLQRPAHFNQAVLLEVQRSLPPNLLRRALAEVREHHEAFRLRFHQQYGKWSQAHAEEEGPDPWLQVDLSGIAEGGWKEALEMGAQQVQESLDLAHGPLLRTVLFTSGPDGPHRLLWVIHHLAVDAVSWRILLEDLEDACRQLIEGGSVLLPPKTTSFQEWALRLAEHARSPALAEERSYWLGRRSGLPVNLPADRPRPDRSEPALGGIVSKVFSVDETRALLQEVPAVYRSRINDALLSALVLSLAPWCGEGQLLVDLEGHGREELFEGVDLSRTVGWFTILYPVALEIVASLSPEETLTRVKGQLLEVPERGIGFGLLRWMSDDPEDAILQQSAPAEVAFNYLGQIGPAQSDSTLFSPARESKGHAIPPDMPATHLLRIEAVVLEGRLRVSWLHSELLNGATVEMLAEGFVRALRRIVSSCREPHRVRYTSADFRLAGLGDEALQRLLSRYPTLEDIYPLAPLQQGLLFHLQLTPDSEAYFEQLSLELRGDLQPEAFRRSCQRVLDRHSILRTSFVWEALHEPLQVVERQVELPWEELDWRGDPPEVLARRLDEYLKADRRRGFDPAQAPLMRVSLIRLGEKVWRLTWSNHHLLLDGWCLGLVFREVVTFYEALACGRDPHLPEPRPYRDFIEWLHRQGADSEEIFWRRTLEGFSTPTSPGLLPRTASEQGGASSREIGESLDSVTTARLATLTRRHRLTLNTLVQGAWALLLSRQSGEEDIVFGTVVSGRPPEIEGVESMIGLFINTVPVRVRVARRAGLIPWLEDLQDRQLELRQHEHSPLHRVQRWSGLPAGTPLFETLLVFENYPVGQSVRESESSFSIHEVRSVEQTHYPVNLLAGPGTALRLKLLFDPERLEGVDARRLLERLSVLLQGISEDPEARLQDLALLPAPERHQLLVEWRGGPSLAPSPDCLHDLFSSQAVLGPERVALIDRQGAMSYGELEAESNRLAGVLRALGAGPETLVGICVERSRALAVGLLGILKCGAAYVPLDPSYPRVRIEGMLEDSAASLVLTGRELLEGPLRAGARRVELDANGRAAGEGLAGEHRRIGAPYPDNLAYVIYTSGSTGRPKGVAIRHRSAVTLVRWASGVFPHEDLAGVLASTSISFDLSIFELFVPWSLGGAVLLTENALDEPPAAEGVEVTLINTVPSAFTEMLRVGAVPRSVRTVNLAGEPLRAALVEEACRTVAGVRVLNLYGPSEDTTYSTWASAGGGGREPGIGRPVANTSVCVLDRWLDPVPEGVPGELFLGGDGLARGYLGMPEPTAERFLPDPFGPAGGRLYRTGDLVRYRPDGELEFLGRLDHQVKLRGFRIELGEVEAALAAHPDVSGVAVTVRDDLAGGRQLVAYVTPGASEPSLPSLRSWLAERLPQHMIPFRFCILQELPRTPNGKIDRRALPVPDQAADEDARGVGARTPMEELVAGLWCEILGLERVEDDDDFFGLGGHSLLATQLVSRLRSSLSLEVPLRSIFERPTLAAMAAYLEELRRPGSLRTAVAIPPVPREAYRVRQEVLSPSAGAGPGGDVYAFPASHAQQRLWLLNQLEPDSAAYNILQCLRMEGRLDLPALQRTLDELTRRHDSLRTFFTRLQGELVQAVGPEVRPGLPLIDLAELPQELRGCELRHLARREALRPFDLGRAPLLRVLLLRLGEEDHAALFSIHHIVSDAWSMAVMVREISVLYASFAQGVSPALPEPPLQYSDYAVFQRQWLQGAVLDDHLAFWKRRLGGALPDIDLARGRRSSHRGGRGSREVFLLSSELTRAVRDLGRREGSTAFMTLLAAFQVLLGQLSGQDDLVVGTAVANRNRSETESLIGFFVNLLALRGDLSGNPSFRQLLARVREETLGAYDHQDLPFDLLVQELGGSGRGAPVFRITFGVQNAPREPLAMPGLRLVPIELDNDQVRYDLTLWMAELDGKLSATWTYDTGLFEVSSIRWMHGQMESILAQVTANPEIRLDELDRPIPEPSEPAGSPRRPSLRDFKTRPMQVRVSS